jgi:hypothetical protein|nr:hypothetical protein [uncultured Capnocytophaga sp.]
MYYFDFKEFVKELREKPDTVGAIEAYEHIYGSLGGKDVTDTQFYKEYFTKFTLPFTCAVPEDLEEDFDWDLLYRLVCASFSCSYYFELREDKKKELYIIVDNGEQQVKKMLSELWSFQVLRLYEIILLEQIQFWTIQGMDDPQRDYESEGDFRIKQQYEYFKEAIEKIDLESSIYSFLN